MAVSGKVGNGPPKYETPELLQEKIDEYIANGDGDRIDKDGNTTKSLTISGLCWFLGFASRQSFYDYEKKTEYAYTIKRARLFIENAYESNLMSHNCTGSIFALKSMGWDDNSSDSQAREPIKIEFVNAVTKDENTPN